MQIHRLRDCVQGVGRSSLNLGIVGFAPIAGAAGTADGQGLSQIVPDFLGKSQIRLLIMDSWQQPTP